MKNGIPVMVFLGFVAVLLHVPGIFADSCDPGHVWVPPYTTPDGVWINGFCRPMEKKDFIWADGHHNPQGVWVPGYWKPIGPPPPGKVWVPGYLDPKGKWVDGYWRPHRVPGKAWMPGHYNRKGHWVPGHYQ